MSRVAQHHRSGAALIIAIVVLAALLMLGLPFLFTQSGSLSGTRSYAHSELANIGQDSAQSMGVKAGAEAIGYHWQQGGMRLLRAPASTPLIVNDWTSLFYDLGGNDDPQSGVHIRSANLLSFDTRNHAFALPGGNFLSGMDSDDRDIQLRRYPIVVGLTIEDESGKLNPNYLDAIAWSRLLEAVGISDWPDVTPSSTPTSTPSSSPNDDRGRNQLARALASLRYHLAGGRITALDQLLLADSSAQRNPRRGLTRSELELLRPYLSLTVPSQARGGMIDLGTVIGRSGKKISIDSAQPAGLIAFPITPLVIGVGTTVLAEDADGIIHAFPVTGDDVVVVPQIGDPLAIDAPPLVNLHQAEPHVRKVLGVNNVDLPPTGPSVAANPSATPPVPARILAPALISELNSNAYSSSKPADVFGRARSWFELTSPLSIPETLGSADVVDAHNNETPRLRMISRDAENKETVPNNAFYLDVSGDSLDHFPNSGQAKLFGTLAIDALPPAGTEITYIQDFEFISYEAKPIGALPQSVGSARANSRVTVYIERGKLSSDAKTFRLNGLKFIAIAPREQHPIGIASQGVITIASAATVTDPAGNQTAQQQHRVIAQALPQETPLEARWNKQAAFHALLAQRHGSLMTTFPQPYPRITDIMPDDPANNAPSASVPTDLDEMAGIRPAVMRTLLSSSHLNHGWTLPVSGTSAQALAGNTAYTSADVTPEGLRLDASRVLSYPNDSGAGLIPDSYNASTKQLAQINGRQFGLWVRPDATWTGQVALLDMRIPSGNFGKSLSGELNPGESSDERLPTTSDVCNRFTLVYDAVLKQVILALNPGNIPHTADYGPLIPIETYDKTQGVLLRDDTWPSVNPECLGSGGLFQMASVPEGVNAGVSDGVIICHRYFFGNGFTAGAWHLVQVAFSSNQPGGMSIIVDGLVGRDVSRQPFDSTAMTIPGDHLTQPSLVLKSSMPTTQQEVDIGAQALLYESIFLDALAFDDLGNRYTKFAAVRRLLPKRGTVLIGNEYIQYQSIKESTNSDTKGLGELSNCVRARRQNPNVAFDRMHVMEAHEIGDAVYPGGFAFSIPTNVQWWRGSCHLAQPMTDGDPGHLYQIWAKVAQDLDITSTAIPINGSSVTDQFPFRGFVLLNGLNGAVEAYYDNVDVDHKPSKLVPPKLLNVHYLNGNDWTPHLPDSLIAKSEVVLISQEIVDVDHPEADPTGTYPPEGLIQLYDARPNQNNTPNAGRAEWISYTEIRSRIAYPNTPPEKRISYLINKSTEILSPVPPSKDPVFISHGGFWFTDGRAPGTSRQGARGQQRTAFAASDISDYTAAPEKYYFPALTTRVIPVQTGMPIAFSLEAGDMITLAPKVAGTIPVSASGTFVDQHPLQMCVRYSAHAAFPYSNGGTAYAWSVRENHFAFTEAIPREWNPKNVELHVLSWPCWTPDNDLGQPAGGTWNAWREKWVLPWGNAFAANFDPAVGKGKVTFLTDANSAAGKAGMIDAIHAGIQPGWQQGGQVQTHILPSSDAIWLDDQPLRERTVVVANQGIFTDLYGIVEIGGETFAYKQWDNESDPFVQSTTQAWLIGRSLLGSTARKHQGPELILRLPIGPVTEVIGSVPPPPPETIPPTPSSPPEPMGTDFTGPLDLVSLPGQSFNSPAVLLTSRDGKNQEITMLPNNHTAPWLRGMYNTIPIEWEVRPPVPAIAPPPTNGRPPPPLPRIPNLAPLAIGWWPRYPSGYPQETASIFNMLKTKQRFLANMVPPQFLSADQLAILKTHAARMRCRSYAWAGFPLRFHEAQFKKLDVPEVTILSDGGGMFDLHAVALDGTMDWSVAGDFSEPNDLTEIFASDRFMVLEDEKLNTRLVNPKGNIRLINGVPQPRKDNARTVDGAELRIIWDYYDDPLPATASPAEWLQKTARNGNSAPMIGPVYLRARAPNKVLSVER